MGTQLGLDDVVRGHPLAEKELRELRGAGAGNRRLRGAAVNAYCVLRQVGSEDAEIAALTLRDALNGEKT